MSVRPVAYVSWGLLRSAFARIYRAFMCIIKVCCPLEEVLMKNQAIVRSFVQLLVFATILHWGSISAEGIVYELSLDDGSIDNEVGAFGNSFIWFNQFAPDAADFPITLTQVQVLFGAGNNEVGDQVDIYVYEDTSGDPRDGAVHRASLTDQQIQAVDEITWSTFMLDSPVTFVGPGDILIGVVNRTTRPDSFPAAIDLTTDQGRSWVGLTDGELPPDPPPIPYGDEFGLIKNFGYSGNWMIRGQYVRADILFQDRFQRISGDTLLGP